MDINSFNFDDAAMDLNTKTEVQTPQIEHIKFDDFSCSVLLSILRVVATGCSDLMLKDSIISQKSDDKRITFMCNISRLLENKTVNMNISKLAEKRDILEIMQRQKSQLNLDISPTLYTFFDDRSQLVIEPGMEKYITNPYITEEMNNNSYGLDQCDTVFTGLELDKDIVERMTKMSKTMSTSSMFLKFSKDKMTLQLTPSDEKNSMIMNLVTFNDSNIELNGLSKFSLFSISNCPPPIYMNVLTRKHQNRSIIVLEINSKFIFTSLDSKDKKSKKEETPGNNNIDGIDMRMFTSSQLV